MRESVELRLSRLGCSLPAFIAAAFIAGHIRGELVLTLTGSLFLTVYVYCLSVVLLLSFVNRKKARSLSARISAGALNPGQEGEVLLIREPAGKGRFFRIPALLVRYEISLDTKDGRTLRYIFDPDGLKDGFASFPVRERGAYYSTWDKLTLCDALGLFRFSFRLYQDGSPRLLVVPHLPETAAPLRTRAGGAEQRRDPHFLRTDDLTDHRPYIPGDDPRRINWKLYGHAGELFVREGEPEPPPHSRLLIMVDTQIDPALFSAEAGRRGVDLLCENALAAALEYGIRGVDILIGYTGGILREGGPAELAPALAWPAALPLGLPGKTGFFKPRRTKRRADTDRADTVRADTVRAEYPPIPEDRGLLILALPRSTTEEGALDRYLKSRKPGQEPDLVFLYRERALHEAAETCTALYGQRPGLHVRREFLGSE